MKYTTTPRPQPLPLPERRLRIASLIESSASRLIRLLKIDAPGIVIEQERQLLLSRITDFPVEAEHQMASQDAKAYDSWRTNEYAIRGGLLDDSPYDPEPTERSLFLQMRELLEDFSDNCTGAEPSLSAFAMKVDGMLAKLPPKEPV